ncbi:MAG: hypothetical protein OFPII_44260 [Osedax symbiont Rs1]|nr:MAG: hypothetical protein OFPII_44260 [Osedax symbiont Rs1]
MQDYHFINLTTSTKQTGEKFAKELCNNIFKKNGFHNEIETYFSPQKKTKLEITLKSLESKDYSFKDYLIKQRISLSEYGSYSEDNKKPILRKIQNIALLRDFHFKSTDKKVGRRTCSEYYSGFYNLCKQVEYNPRMLIGLMNLLLEKLKTNDNISVSDQIFCLKKSYKSFSSLLATISIESSDTKFTSIFELVESIAEIFMSEIKLGPFNPEPKGTIIFKKESNTGLFDSIGLALNAGALIVDQGSTEEFHDVSELKSIKCRLSYIFAHEYSLLLNKGREIDFSDILSLSGNDQMELL